jgi:hypothetical protein
MLEHASPGVFHNRLRIPVSGVRRDVRCECGVDPVGCKVAGRMAKDQQRSAGSHNDFCYAPVAPVGAVKIDSARDARAYTAPRDGVTVNFEMNVSRVERLLFIPIDVSEVERVLLDGTIH